MEAIQRGGCDGYDPEDYLDRQQPTGDLEEGGELLQARSVLDVAVVHVKGEISMQFLDRGGFVGLDVGLDHVSWIAVNSHRRGQRIAAAESKRPALGVETFYGSLLLGERSDRLVIGDPVENVFVCIRHGCNCCI
jgi:hypothetical protein